MQARRAAGMQNKSINSMTDTSVADFDSVEQLLNGVGASWEAAEAHGAFCGRACLTGAAAIPLWVTELVGDRDGGDVLAGERAATLEQLAANTILSLEAGEMSFQLLIPTDEAPLSARTAALADWCHGFMQGLVAAGGADEGVQADALDSEIVSEILEDFSEITKAGAADEADEEAEAAFAEVVEYVRVSAQLVYDETAALRQRTTSGGSA